MISEAYGLPMPPRPTFADVAALDRRVGLAKPWRLHDLRRTAATIMADKLGVLPHIIEAVLNHVSGHKSGVAGVYNLAKYENEMRLALSAWADYVASLADTAPVTSTPLRLRA